MRENGPLGGESSLPVSKPSPFRKGSDYALRPPWPSGFQLVHHTR
jgi:hypothetical protein